MSPGARPGDYELAVQYVAAVKDRFGDVAAAYTTFLGLLHKRPAGNADIMHVVDEVCRLMRGHPDMLVGFAYFVPAEARAAAAARLQAAAAGDSVTITTVTAEAAEESAGKPRGGQTEKSLRPRHANARARRRAHAERRSAGAARQLEREARPPPPTEGPTAQGIHAGSGSPPAFSDALTFVQAVKERFKHEAGSGSGRSQCAHQAAGHSCSRSRPADSANRGGSVTADSSQGQGHGHGHGTYARFLRVLYQRRGRRRPAAENVFGFLHYFREHRSRGSRSS
jgi:hypothetical protein